MQQATWIYTESFQNIYLQMQGNSIISTIQEQVRVNLVHKHILFGIRNTDCTDWRYIQCVYFVVADNQDQNILLVI
jgi:hypothetical protein